MRIAIAFLLTAVSAAFAETPVRDLNTLRTFPKIESKEQWQERARLIREHVLVSCGLWPTPPKTPLNAKVFGRVERDGYSIEKVYFETYPGFFLAGNLYRPLGKTGPFPGILNPHGHWRNGRMADEDAGSIAARCISFARQGMVAFTYDMAGYNDTIQVDHKFAADLKNTLWSISLMGLQTWNSVRALDFLESLPDVDKSRLACTGESGGGTQTFMLGTFEDRLAMLGPIVMVSHSMQGGCLCENAPGLRVDYSNMELAAVPAPRPQILVAATGDWTKTTQEIEGPAVASIYKLFGATDHLKYATFNYGHNYNKTSREAVYAWFGRHLLQETDANKLKEPPYKKEPDSDLRVFPDGKLPQGALNEAQLIGALVDLARQQLADLEPRDAASLAKAKETLAPSLKHSLQIHDLAKMPKAEKFAASAEGSSLQFLKIDIAADREPLVAFRRTKAGGSPKKVVILARSPGAVPFQDATVDRLIEKDIAVVSALFFRGNDETPAQADAGRDYKANFFSAYNRTDIQERVRELIALCRYARQEWPDAKIGLVGEGRAGLWTILAAHEADALVADCAQLDTSNPDALLAQDLYFPGSLRSGGFATALALAAPRPVFLHNMGERFGAGWLGQLYYSLPNRPSIALHKDSKSTEDGLAWLVGL